MQSIASKFSSLALTPPPTYSSSSSHSSSSLNKNNNQQWRLWLYECRDIPLHERRCAVQDRCGFCYELKQLLPFLSNNNTTKFIDESDKRWFDHYLKKKQLFERPQAMLQTLENGSFRKDGLLMLPSQMIREIFFDKKLGFAFFREGIPPDYEHPENKSSGCFKQLFVCKTGDSEKVATFDRIFQLCLRTIVEEEGAVGVNGKVPATTISTVGRSIIGLFIRCEISCKNVKKDLKTHTDYLNLPCLMKLELWVGNGLEDKKRVEELFIPKLMERLKEIKGGNVPFMRFSYFPLKVHRPRDFTKSSREEESPPPRFNLPTSFEGPPLCNLKKQRRVRRRNSNSRRPSSKEKATTRAANLPSLAAVCRRTQNPNWPEQKAPCPSFKTCRVEHHSNLKVSHPETKKNSSNSKKTHEAPPPNSTKNSKNVQPPTLHLQDMKMMENLPEAFTQVTRHRPNSPHSEAPCLINKLKIFEAHCRGENNLKATRRKPAFSSPKTGITLLGVQQSPKVE